jgi:hypothetical protein
MLSTRVRAIHRGLGAQGTAQFPQFSRPIVCTRVGVPDPEIESVPSRARSQFQSFGDCSKKVCVLLLPFVTRLEATVAIRAGDEIKVSVRPGSWHLFEPHGNQDRLV